MLKPDWLVKIFSCTNPVQEGGDMVVFPNVYVPTQSQRKWRNIVQINEQEKTPEIMSNEMEIYELPGREFKITHKNAWWAYKNNK